MEEKLQRHERITKRIESAFDEIDPRWRKVDEGEEIQRVCYSWGVNYGQVALDVSGSAVTPKNHDRFCRAIVKAVVGG